MFTHDLVDSAIGEFVKRWAKTGDLWDFANGDAYLLATFMTLFASKLVWVIEKFFAHFEIFYYFS